MTAPPSESSGPAPSHAQEVGTSLEVGPSQALGRRVVVTGPAGSGKSTFARALAVTTGLPVIHLDEHFWQPGWVETPHDQWREVQRRLLVGDAWIVEGNYVATLDLRLERADTIVYLDTPWWVCAARAFARGLRSRPTASLPEGCPETAFRRLCGEWRLIGMLYRGRRSEREQEFALIAKHGQQAALHVLRSKREASAFVECANVRRRCDAGR